MKASLRVILSLIGAALYLSLAIAGWKSPGAFFAHPPLIAAAAILVLMTIVALFAGGNLNPGVREDRANRWVLIAFTVLGLAGAYIPAWSDRTDFWTFDGDTVRWTGIVLFAAGGALRIGAVFVLGDRFSGLVAIQPGHTLMTTGMYRTIRNPSYAGLLINSFGWDLAFRSGAGLLVTALLLPPLVVRMHSEEKLLQAQFGAEYAAYRARTWRLIPRLY